MKLYINIILLCAVLTSCIEKANSEDIAAFEDEIISLNEEIRVIEFEKNELKREYDELNSSYSIDFNAKDLKVDNLNELVDSLEHDIWKLERELDQTKEEVDDMIWWHNYFVGNVNGYLEDNDKNLIIGEWVKVGDEIGDQIITKIDVYKDHFHVVQFEADVIITGFLSEIEVNNEFYGYIELDSKSIEQLPGFFEMNIGGFRIENSSDYINQIKDNIGTTITIRIDGYEIGNFPPGWDNSINMIEFID